jgi:hypothetical protein
MSDWLGFDPTPYTVDEWWGHVRDIKDSDMTWHPVGICLHATGLPTLAQWVELGPAHDQRLKNLEHYYQSMSWQHGPHAFVSRSHINGFSSLKVRGTHSTCYNYTHFGIEQSGNFNIGHDDYNSGEGAMVKASAIACMAALCKRFSLSPKSIVPHSSCKADGHSQCPGNLVSMSEIIEKVGIAMSKLAMLAVMVLLLGVMGTAHAAKLKLNCGLPFPDAGCYTPNNPSVNPKSPTSVVSGLIAHKEDILAFLQAVDVADKQIIEGSSPPQMWDPVGHQCIAGIGVEGQPGYVPGLAYIVNAIKLPPEPPTLKGFDDNPFALLIKARLAARALAYDLGALNGTADDFAQYVVMSCGGILASINGDILSVAGSSAALAKIILLIIPK